MYEKRGIEYQAGAQALPRELCMGMALDAPAGQGRHNDVQSS